MDVTAVGVIEPPPPKPPRQPLHNHPPLLRRPLLHLLLRRPLLFFALASALSYASSSLLRHPIPHPLPPTSTTTPSPATTHSSSAPSASPSPFFFYHLHPRLSCLSLPVPSGLGLSISLSCLHLASPPSPATTTSNPFLISKITNSVTRLLSTILYADYVKIPVGHRLLHTVHSFKDLLGGPPNVCRAIDGSPIKIKLPSSTTATSTTAFRSHHGGHPAVLLQAVADHRAIF